MDGPSGDLQSEPNASEVEGLSEVDLSNSGRSKEDEGNEQQQQQPQQQTGSTHQLEFFEGGGGRGGGQHSGAESSGGSPDQMTRDKDSDSTHAAFVTLSPPISPGTCGCGTW